MAFIGAKPTNVPLTANDITDGSISVAKLTSTLDLSSNTVTLPTGVGGKVLQVVSSSTTSEYSSTTTSFTTYTAINRTITALSSNSKFMRIFNPARIFNSSASNNDIQFTDQTNNSNYIRFYSGYGGTGTAINPSITSIISGNHSAGDTLTISMQGRVTAGNMTVGDTGTPSTMFVLEVE